VTIAAGSMPQLDFPPARSMTGVVVSVVRIAGQFRKLGPPAWQNLMSI